MFDSPDFFQRIRAKSTALCVCIFLSICKLSPIWFLLHSCFPPERNAVSPFPHCLFQASRLLRFLDNKMEHFLSYPFWFSCTIPDFALNCTLNHPFDTTWLISPIREQHSLALNPKWFSRLSPLSWNHLSGYQASFRSSQVWWAMGSLTTPTMDLDCQDSSGHRS